jgi:ABC-type sugar transport system ATPase subunit
MSVRQNLSFGLKIRRTSKTEIARRVERAGEMLGIERLLDRKPRELSGGQRQRVALGRALVRDPQVFLMDEPLSNLDAQLRAQTRGEIRRLQREVGTTTVYVTHDQVEAMTMGDRIAIMRDGVLEQVGHPDTVYAEPANTFVAGFIGSPAMGLTRVGVDHADGAARLVLGDLRLDVGSVPATPGEVVLGVRPEHTRLWDGGGDLLGPIDGRVEYVESLGRETLVGVVAPGESRFVVVIEGLVQMEPGSTLRFGLRRGWLYLFDAEEERALGRI